MKPILHMRFIIILNNRLYWSQAYQSLTPAAKNLLWCFVAELSLQGQEKKKNFGYTNNGTLSFEDGFKFNKLGSSQTYINARNQLVK